MAVVEVKTFKDIQDAILRRGKIEDTEDNRTAIKEYINTDYQLLTREEPYRWLGSNAAIRLRGSYSTGTITTVDGSDEVTGSSTVWVENDHRFSRMKIAGSTNTRFKIIRVESNTALTLDQQFIGTGASSVSYEIFRDEYGLPPDLQDIRKLRIPGLSNRSQPQPLSPEKMDILRDRSPFRGGTPLYYTVNGQAHYTEKTWADFNIGTDFWETSLDDVPVNPALIVWPSILTTDRMVEIRYTRKAFPMNLDTDEPLIPYEDRAVLVWGVLSERFLVNRDIPMRREWQRQHKDMKRKMAADIETTDDELILHVNARRYSRGRSFLLEEDEIFTGES